MMSLQVRKRRGEETGSSLSALMTRSRKRWKHLGLRVIKSGNLFRTPKAISMERRV